MTVEEAEILSLALEKNGGAHAHTAGKAKFYLRQLIDKPKARFSNCTQEQFVTLVREAVYNGDWKSLSNKMAGWW